MIGIDLVSVEEFRHQINKGGEVFLRSNFTESELGNRGVAHLAGLYAAKAAVIKAAPSALELSDVELSVDRDGRSCARARTIDYEVSISRHGDYAVAVAMMVRHER